MIEWDERQHQLRDAFAAYGEALNEPGLGAHGSEFSPERWALVAQSGLLRLPFEKEYGGLGEDLLTTMFVLEGLGHGCRDGGLLFSVCTQIVSSGIPLQKFGSEELKTAYLPRLCEGSCVGCHAITEPQGGSDVLNTQTTAIECDDHFVLTGTKTFVTNAPIADVFVVYAQTDPRGGPFGLTAFVVDGNSPGLWASSPVEKMGLEGSPAGTLVLDDCAVPAENVIGKPGTGFLVLDYVMKWEILCSFIVSAGAMQHRLERCIERARTRRQFGQSIGSFQSIANKIVDMKIGVETSRRWLYETAAAFVERKDVASDLAIAKIIVSETNVASALDAIQIFGADGYSSKTGLEAELRDAVGGTIYSGTSEIQRNRIAHSLGLGHGVREHKRVAA